MGPNRTVQFAKGPVVMQPRPVPFEGSQVPGDVVEDGSEVDEGEAGGQRRDKHAIPPEALRGAIEEGRGCKIPTVKKPIPIAGNFYVF